MLEGERLLITGGAGFIGSSLVERLAPRNQVTIIDDLSSGSLQNLESVRGKIRLVARSILDREAVLRSAKGCTLAFHLAALTSVPESFVKPDRYADVNVLGTASVLAAAHLAGIRRVVFASTCAVYGPTRLTRLSENVKPNPKSPYAMAKLAAEQLCGAARGSTNLEVVILRIFNAYGPRQSTSSPYASVVARFVDAAKRGESVVVFGSGTQTRDFVFVGDVAEAFELAAMSQEAAGGIFNVGTGRAVSVLQLLKEVESVAGRKLQARREPARRGDLARSLADVRRAREILGFEAKTSLAEGLEATLMGAR